ncbi:MAG: hypothetical protein QOH47_2063 [Sphingomonadales bacterium]|jgi:hypothetical protein|nr:hypothetical protein [Sphingomonadales bacterium]
MHFIALSISIQILCAVHCVRGGRNQLWLMVIIFLSIPGCLAYAFFEILPELAGRREVRAMKRAAAKVLDPERDLRAARDALDIAETAANHSALADALGALGRWSEAIPHYEAAENKAPGIDRGLQLKRAKACFEAGRTAQARALLERLPPSGSQSENDRAALLLARLLETDGETERALAIYADVGERLPGAEAQCRRAALLIAEGRPAEALPLLAEAEKRARRMDRHERAKEAEMYDWAAERLAELRTGRG